MSGGVDSSVAAALLQQRGYDVVGCFMRLGSPGDRLDEPALDAAPPACDPVKVRLGHQGCCSVGDAADARLVASRLGIPLYVVNFKRDFGRIMDYFADEYAAGRTPNPCVRCNDWLKFGKLFDYARQIGADFIATGHYARVHRDGARAELRRGLDHAKDQSYVLFGLARDALDRVLLPIGDMHKPDVRRLARDLRLPVFDKPDSQEICFVPDNDYAAFVERRRPDLARSSPGDIIDESGAAIGAHAGQHRFTIGQRRGVGVALGRPVYVVAKDPAARTVTIGPAERLLAARCAALEANWLTDAPPPGAWFTCLARYRSNGAPVPARARSIDPPADSGPNYSGRAGAFDVEFAQPQSAVAPGQAVVLYAGDGSDRVLGGGWIARVG